MPLAAIDSSARIVELLAYSGIGVLVGAVTGFAARLFYEELKRKAERAEREAIEAAAIAEEARQLAWMAKDEAQAVKD